MKTIIAEKPSVAREIARIVGATEREEGYFTGNGYNVTWAFGHKVGCPTPMNDCVVDIIHRIERGELRPNKQNLRLFHVDIDK